MENNEYIGNEGTFRITKKEEGMIAGVYSSKVVSDNGLAVNIESGSFVDVKVTALIPTEMAIQENLTACYSNLYEYIEFAYLFDAVYSNEISAPNSSWTEIYQHTQSPENEKILKLWVNAYEMIYKTNLILRSSELVISDEATRNIINAQAKAIRAYLNYTLMTWFGEIPLQLGHTENMIPRSILSEVITQISNDAIQSKDVLPSSWAGGDKFRIPNCFSLSILARIYINDFKLPYSWPPQSDISNYTNSEIYSKEIINSAIYRLSTETNNFSETNSEIIWGFSKNRKFRV